MPGSWWSVNHSDWIRFVEARQIHFFETRWMAWLPWTLPKPVVGTPDLTQKQREPSKTWSSAESRAGGTCWPHIFQWKRSACSMLNNSQCWIHAGSAAEFVIILGQSSHNWHIQQKIRAASACCDGKANPSKPSPFVWCSQLMMVTAWHVRGML